MTSNVSTSFVILTIFLLIFTFFNSTYAETDSIDVKLIVFENTSIIEFTNHGTEPIHKFKFWLNPDYSFLSFKSEYGWTGEKNNQGVLIFSSNSTLEFDQVVKFGFKTNQSDIGINWKAEGDNEQQLEINNTLSLNVDEIVDQNILETAFLPTSNFTVVPELPRIFSTVRISGNNFVAHENFVFFMDEQKIHSFATSSDGHFIFTKTIQDTFVPGPILYTIKDSHGNQIYLDGHIGQFISKKIPEIKLSVNEILERYSIGDEVLFAGQVTPETQVLIKIFDSTNITWAEKNTTSDKDGNWSFTFTISPQSSFGTYTAKIQALDYKMIKQWDVLLSKQIDIIPSQLIFSSNEFVSFIGTAKPGELLKLFLINSDGKQIHSVENTVPESGSLYIEYVSDFFIPDTTYFLYAFQGNAAEVIKFGVEKYPQKILSSKMNKINYHNDEIAYIAISGNPSELLNLSLVDYSGNSIFEDKITLGSEGKFVYALTLKDLSMDYYSVIISKGSIKTTESFTINFPSGFNYINYDFIKITYLPNDQIKIYGKTTPKILLNYTLIDPELNIINKINSFSNNDGAFSTNDFKIPLNPIDGKWVLKISSGTNYENIFFNVDSKSDIFSVKVSEIHSTTHGLLVLIEGKNAAPEKIVNVSIHYKNSNQSWEIPTRSTKDGNYSVIWLVPEDAREGNYLIKSLDGESQYIETTFKI